MQKPVRTSSAVRVKCQQPVLSSAEKQITAINSNPAWDKPIKKHLIELLAINAIMQQRPGLANPELSKYEQALKPGNGIPRKIRAQGEQEVWRLTNPSLRLPNDVDNDLKTQLEPLLKSIDSTRIANFNYRITRDDAEINRLTQSIKGNPHTHTHYQPLRDNFIKQQVDTIIKKREIITNLSECEKDAELLEKYIPLTQNKELSDQLNELLELFIEDIADAELNAEFAQQTELKKTTPPSAILSETNALIIEKPNAPIETITIVATETPADVLNEEKNMVIISQDTPLELPQQTTNQENHILTPVIEEQPSDESFDLFSQTPDDQSTGENSPAQASEDSSEEELNLLPQPVQKDIGISDDAHQVLDLAEEEESESAEIIENPAQKDNAAESLPELPSADEKSEAHQEQTQITNTSWLLWLLSKSSHLFWWCVSFFISL